MTKKGARLISRIQRLTSAEGIASFLVPRSGMSGRMFSKQQILAEHFGLAVLISTGMSSRTTWGPRICFKQIKANLRFPTSCSRLVDLRRTPCECCQTLALHLDCDTTGKTHLSTA